MKGMLVLLGTCFVSSGQDLALSGLSVLICKTGGLDQKVSKGPSGLRL